MPRIGIYGWGVVAPRSPNVEAFARNLESAESWLAPFDGLGPSNFLAGHPEFDFAAYRPWIDARFPPNKYPQLSSKMGWPTQYAIGAFIQALGQNEGIEQVLAGLGHEAHVLVGTGLGDIITMYDSSVDLDRATRRWFAFWAAPEHNEERRAFDAAPASDRARWSDAPVDPATVSDRWDKEAALKAWDAYWASRSSGLRTLLAALNEIEKEGVTGEVAVAKLHLMRRKRTASERLIRKAGCPTPPWWEVPAELLWNIHNTPAAQISMLGHITGATFAPVAACSTFGVALQLGVEAIRRGDARAVVVGATDPPPHGLSVGTFYRARVLASDHEPSVPLTDLRGTHVAGGACVWIIGDVEFMDGHGFAPLGLEVLGVGVTSDADHIITPSADGPQEAIRLAFADAGVAPASATTWDLHATATPGDFQEVANLSNVLDQGVVLTARKGTFGHGMSCCGGWELMAQHLGLERGTLFPTPLDNADLNPSIAGVPFRYVTRTGCDHRAEIAGKLSMGVGGINACVISRPWES